MGSSVSAERRDSVDDPLAVLRGGAHATAARRRGSPRALDAQILALTAGAALLGKDRLRRLVGRFPAWKSRLLFLKE